MKKLALAALVAAYGLTAQAEIIIVSQFGPDVDADSDVNNWTDGFTRNGGEVIHRDLALDGGILEAFQPSGPVGVARVTTTSNPSDIAELRNRGNFGNALAGLADIDLSYSFFKVDTGALAAAPAPSLKLEIGGVIGGTGDNYGQLVFEPYRQSGESYQQGGVSGANPVTGSWENVDIDQDLGQGDDSIGGWWWTGGFGMYDGVGSQSDIRSLAEWNAEFQAQDPTDWGNATIIGVAVGVGSSNEDQIGYFDSISFNANGIDKTFQFAAVPEPSSALLISLVMGAFGAYHRKKRRLTAA